MELLLRRWGELPKGVRRQVIGGAAARLVGALERLAGAEDRAGRRAAASVARWTPLPAATRVAGRLLADGEAMVADAAEATLASLVDHAGALKDEQRDALVRTLLDAVASYPLHRRRAVVTAAERLGPLCSPAVRAWLKGADDAALMALRAAIRRADDAGAARRAVVWLGEPACAPAALDALREAKSEDRRAGALRASHMLHDRERVAQLAREPRAAALARSAPTAARRDALRWRRLCGGARDALLDTSMGALLEPDPLVRSDALGIIRREASRSENAADALRDFAFDPEAAISRSAALALAWLPGQTQSARTALDTLRRSAHAQTRRVAEEAFAPAALHRRMLALRRRLEEEPDLAIAHLRGRMREGDAASRCEAILLARRLRTLDRLERDLIACFHDEHPRVTATAVSALAAMDSGGARAAVSSALAHRDARVRANAIEGAGRRDPVGAAVLRAAHDDHARTRANAVRARLALAPGEAAADCLEAMLLDDRPEHRLSALWVAERLPTPELARRVLGLREDPDARVRQRATRCARRLALLGSRSEGAAAQ